VVPRRNQAENTGIPADAAAICATCPINAQCRQVGEAGSGWLLARRVDDVDAKRIRRRHQHHNWPTPTGQSA
jgi:hypothetical protein